MTIDDSVSVINPEVHQIGRVMNTPSLPGKLFEMPRSKEAAMEKGLTPAHTPRRAVLTKLVASLRDYPFGCGITARWILREGRSGNRA